MRARQLWFFPHPKPLVERFGEKFFRELPRRPAVYLMCGPAEGVLYVGKARDLRKRLASYRVANPDRMPRRIIRLLTQVTRIEWDECPDESAASCREELLITVLQPKFNRVGKVWPRASGYGVPPSGGGAWEYPVVGRIFNSPDHATAPPSKARTPYPNANYLASTEQWDVFAH